MKNLCCNSSRKMGQFTATFLFTQQLFSTNSQLFSTLLSHKYAKKYYNKFENSRYYCVVANKFWPHITLNNPIDMDWYNRYKHLITTDQLITECQSWHDTSLFQPEDGSERPRKENSLNSSKRHKPLGIWRSLILDPTQRPLSLLLHTRYGLNCIEKLLTVRTKYINKWTVKFIS